MIAPVPNGTSGRRIYRGSVPSSGEREFYGALLMVVGLLFWLNGAGYLSLWFLLLPESWSEAIGKVLMALGAVLVVSALV
jgi:hypothetical protein